ncbi:uncharacterized protein [Ptychodera flava]|uniref:uncharacterized protein n=1 Tax=Ptychodera flava TaxID=63121 RepID=UPI00396A65CD
MFQIQAQTKQECDMNPSEDALVRAYLWTAFRSCSTAFEQSIRTLEGVKVIHEIFADAALLGEDRSATLRHAVRFHTDTGFRTKDPLPGLRLSEVKIALEDTFQGYRGVFVKDMAIYLVAMGKMDYIPDGYRHAFLIRKPIKSITSLYRCFSKQNVDELREIITSEAGFREMFELYQYIRDVKGQTPMVIDADDDLLRDPATTMKTFCDFVGFQFKESMVHWKPGRPEEWSWHDAWYGTIASSAGFIRNPETQNSFQLEDISLYPSYIQEAIQDAQPYYEKLYNLRSTQ